MAENNFDIGTVLNGVLSNPELLSQAMGLAKQLKDGGLGNLGNTGGATAGRSEPTIDYNIHNGTNSSAPANLPHQNHNAFYSPSFGEEYSFPYGSDGSVYAFRQPDAVNADPTPRYQTPATLPAFVGEASTPAVSSCGCNGGGNHTVLLEALRPYLGEGRQNKLDFILKILNLMQLADKSGVKIF